MEIDTFDGAKPRFLNRGKKRRSVSTLTIPRASDRGVEWVDFKFMREEVTIIGRNQKKRGRKKGQMPKVDFDLKAIRKIKKRKKEICKGNLKHSN